MINFTEYYRTMTSITIPNSVKITNNSLCDAFYGMRKLKTYNINHPSVTNLVNTYYSCYNLTGSPVCGDNVINMSGTYHSCTNLTGSPVCGNNVVNMSYAYYKCYHLTTAIFSEKVNNVAYAYESCPNIQGNVYISSTTVNNARNVFSGRNVSNRLNIYVPSTGTTLTMFTYTNIASITGTSITWTDDTITNGCYYNTTQNIYIYPVANIEQARIANGD